MIDGIDGTAIYSKECPKTPGDWVSCGDGKWENYMGNIIEEGSNRVPYINPPFKNRGEKLGAYIHYYIACKLLGENPVFESSHWKEFTLYYGDLLMKGFVDKYVDKVLGVEAVVSDPDDFCKKVRFDLICDGKDPYGCWDSQPTCIVDWKYVNGKFYPENYCDQMKLYEKAYTEAQWDGGPLLSHVLVVAVNSAGRVKIERYFGEDT